MHRRSCENVKLSFHAVPSRQKNNSQTAKTFLCKLTYFQIASFIGDRKYKSPVVCDSSMSDNLAAEKSEDGSLQVGS